MSMRLYDLTDGDLVFFVPDIKIQFPPDLQTVAGLILGASVDGQDQTRIIWGKR